MGAVERDQGSARRRRAGSAQRAPGPAHLPAQGRGRRSAPVPQLRRGAPEPQGQRQVRRLHRLLALSRLPLYAPAHAAGRRPGGSLHAGRQAARPRSRDGAAPSRCAPAGSGPTCSSARAPRRRSPSAPPIPKGVDANTVDLDYALKLLSLPRDDRQCIPRPASRSRPASAATGRSSCTTAPTPTCRRWRRCSRSASTAPSCCWRRRRPAAARAASSAPRRPCSRSSASIRAKAARCRCCRGATAPTSSTATSTPRCRAARSRRR